MIEALNYGSHLPPLMACAAVCGGPVLEIGSGNFSTPCLHSLCAALGLPLTTTELEDAWREQFMHFADHSHRVLKQTDELLRELAAQQWGLVLVDDQPHTRMERLDMFFDSARFILFHDANFDDYRQPLEAWVAARNCNHRIYTKVGPHTLVASKSHVIPQF